MNDRERRKFEIIRVARFESKSGRDRLGYRRDSSSFSSSFSSILSHPDSFVFCVSARCSIRFLDSYNFTVGLTFKRLSPPSFASSVTSLPSISLFLLLFLLPCILLPRPPVPFHSSRSRLLYIKIRALKTRLLHEINPLDDILSSLLSCVPLIREHR